MTHTLQDLIPAIIAEEIAGDTSCMLSDITCDSRKVTPGSLFIAVRGVNADGHDFIPQAIAGGACAIVCETIPPSPSPGVTWIRVSDASTALGQLASQWWGNPSDHLTLVGVTGTNGKTTVATLLYEMARSMGFKAGLLSTVENRIGDKTSPATHTTPDPLTLNGLLHRMVQEGCTFAAMEVSSHACAQHRISGLTFAGGIFTNLTRDHLDYHKTVDAYLKAKKSFFDNLPSSAFALTNADDRNGTVMLQNCKARKATYSLRGDATFRGRITESRMDGTSMTFDSVEVETLFTGRFNASNLTAVYGASIMLRWDKEQVLVNISRLIPVAGRFQTFRSPSGVTAIVDYAHTPDAIANVLGSIGEVLGNKGKIITVTGAGGNRDHGKRPLMAAEAARRSSRVIITSDNPRDEDPADIASMMLGGLSQEQRLKTITILDRREAIRTAIALASPGDVVLVAGKGHETYQEIKGVRHHFDDREVVIDELGIRK